MIRVPVAALILAVVTAFAVGFYVATRITAPAPECPEPVPRPALDGAQT